MKNHTKVERTSERELVASRIINGPSNLVFEAWTNPELFKKWWVPKSAPITLVSCEMDIRTGGKYRLRFSMGSQSMEFFGKYLEVTPHSRLVWTNEEGGEDAAVITTVTFEEIDGTTLVTVHDLYPSKEALDDAIATESTGALPEQLEQLDQFIVNQRNP
ncbi:MAG TPA: SRPBCC family protein [Gammaproteobacteria bacterium]